MPKKVSEIQKKEMIEIFINGGTIEELSEKFSCTKPTITKYLKKGVNAKLFKSLFQKNNRNRTELDFRKNANFENTFHKKNSEEQSNETDLIEDSSFVELTPLSFEIDNERQKDLSSISISEINFPKIVYFIVDSKIELKTKLLRDYPDWQFLSQKELNRTTIELFFDLQVAKRFCAKEQKVIKVPNPNVFKIAAHILLAKGISRIVCPDNLIAL